MAYTSPQTQALFTAATSARENGERFFVARLYEQQSSGGIMSGSQAVVLVATAGMLAAVEAAGWTLVSTAPTAGQTHGITATFRVADR